MDQFKMSCTDFHDVLLNSSEPQSKFNFIEIFGGPGSYELALSLSSYLREGTAKIHNFQVGLTKDFISLENFREKWNETLEVYTEHRLNSDSCNRDLISRLMSQVSNNDVALLKVPKRWVESITWTRMFTDCMKRNIKLIVITGEDWEGTQEYRPRNYKPVEYGFHTRLQVSNHVALSQSMEFQVNLVKAIHYEKRQKIFHIQS